MRSLARFETGLPRDVDRVLGTKKIRILRGTNEFHISSERRPLLLIYASLFPIPTFASLRLCVSPLPSLRDSHLDSPATPATADFPPQKADKPGARVNSARRVSVSDCASAMRPANGRLGVAFDLFGRREFATATVEPTQRPSVGSHRTNGMFASLTAPPNQRRRRGVVLCRKVIEREERTLVIAARKGAIPLQRHTVPDWKNRGERPL